MSAVRSRPAASVRPGAVDLSVVAVRTEAELAQVRELRRRIFGDEQGITEGFADPDDARSVHALVYARSPEDGRTWPVATARLTLGFGQSGEALIAWVATLPDVRRRGAATAAIRFLLESADAAGAPVVLLSAQTYAIPLYRRLGFRAYGNRFQVRGIEHQWMARPHPHREHP